jgi:hypothetical protein
LHDDDDDDDDDDDGDGDGDSISALGIEAVGEDEARQRRDAIRYQK